MNLNRCRRFAYEESYAIGVAFLTTTAALAVCLAAYALSPALAVRLRSLPWWVVALFAVAWFLGLVHMLSISAWHSITFRYLAYRISLLAQRIWRWLWSSLGGGITLLAIATLLRWAVPPLLNWSYFRMKNSPQDRVALLDWFYFRISDSAQPQIDTIVGLEPLLDLLKPMSLATTIGAILLLVMIRGAYKARKRIVILPFDDYTIDDSKPGQQSSAQSQQGNIEGLASRLRSELASLTKLYKVIDEASPTCEGTGGLSATPEGTRGLSVGVEDIGEALKGAVDADTKVSLGPFSMPISWLLTTSAHLVQGPRLSGSLHRASQGTPTEGERFPPAHNPSGLYEYPADAAGRSGGERGDEADSNGKTKDPAELRSDSDKHRADYLILIAELSGGGMSWNWRVESKDLKEIAGQDEVLDDVGKMIRLMAYRIFTDLVRVGSPRWEAVRHFSEGLRSYRQIQRTETNRRVKLREAERHFMEALRDDSSFAQCHYNLGIVYNFLNEPNRLRPLFGKQSRPTPQMLTPVWPWQKSTAGKDSSMPACSFAIR